MTGYVVVALALPVVVGLMRWGIAKWRGISGMNDAAMKWISVSDLKKWLQGAERPAVIDVRSPAEFDGPLGHIAGAVNVPLADFQERFSDTGIWWQGPVVLVCRTEMRSASAAALLKERDIAGVHVLRGGMEAWNRMPG